MENFFFEEGYLSFLLGKSIDDNPYKRVPPNGKFDALEWSNGWLEAESDSKEN